MIRTLQGGLAGLLLLVGVLAGSPALADPTFPTLTGRVVDEANVLSPEAEAQINAQSAQLEQQTGHQFVVATLSSLQGYPIEDYGYQLLRHWQIGRRGQNDGVILIVVPSEHKVRIEVGYGLEPTLTDALSSVILQRAVLPQFRAGNTEAGITAGATEIVRQLGAGDTQAKQANEAATAQVRRPHGSLFAGLIPLIILIVILRAVFGGRRRGGGGWLAPLIIGSAIGNSLGRRSSWGGGGDWGGGGWGGGGGFSGGGGSGGGGGASGSW